MDIGDQRDILDPLATNSIGQIAGARDGTRIFGFVAGLGVALNIDRGPDVAIDQAAKRFVGIKTSLITNGRTGPIHIILEDLLARLNQLGRLANQFGDLNGLPDIVLLDRAAETAAKECGVDHDGRWREASNGLDGRNTEFWAWVGAQANADLLS